MRIINFNLSSKRIAFISLLCCTVIAALFFTLKSNSFRNMWSLADSNVEALSDVENVGNSFRYDYFNNSIQAQGENPQGIECFLNSCESGGGICVVDKFTNYYMEIDFISVASFLGANARAWLDSLGDFLEDLPEATWSVVKSIISKFKGGKTNNTEIKGSNND